MSKVLAVVPTCRQFEIPVQNIEVDWCLVHDREERPITVEEPTDVNLYRGRYAHKIVRPDLELYGERTAAIRQSGFDLGYDEGYDIILTVDDDCRIPPTWAKSHRDALSGSVPVCNNTVPGHVIRGLTVGHQLPVGISHGLWSGVLDYPAWYQISAEPGLVEITDKGWHKIDTPFPMSSMNVGFRREALPAVYFQHIFRRHDDIFAGWLAQRVLGLHGFGFVNGGAVVLHQRASNAEKNLREELPGDRVNKRLLDHIRGFDKTFKDPRGTYGLLARHVARLHFDNRELDDKVQKMAQSMIRWAQRRQT